MALLELAEYLIASAEDRPGLRLRHALATVAAMEKQILENAARGILLVHSGPETEDFRDYDQFKQSANDAMAVWQDRYDAMKYGDPDGAALWGIRLLDQVCMNYWPLQAAYKLGDASLTLFGKSYDNPIVRMHVNRAINPAHRFQEPKQVIADSKILAGVLEAIDMALTTAPHLHCWTLAKLGSLTGMGMLPKSGLPVCRGQDVVVWSANNVFMHAAKAHAPREVLEAAVIPVLRNLARVSDTSPLITRGTQVATDLAAASGNQGTISLVQELLAKRRPVDSALISEI